MSFTFQIPTYNFGSADPGPGPTTLTPAPPAPPAPTRAEHWFPIFEAATPPRPVDIHPALSKFAAFRPDQVRAIRVVLAALLHHRENPTNTPAHILLSLPTGAGKSLVASALAYMFSRAPVITSTRVLQDQYSVEFPGLVDLRGKSNYRCDLLSEMSRPVYASNGPCNEGYQCHLRESCGYYRQLARANEPDATVLTNYAARILNMKLLSTWNLTVIDEAHNAGDQLILANTYDTNRYTIQQYLGDIPPRGVAVELWAEFFIRHMQTLELLEEQHQRARSVDSARALRDIRNLQRICRLLLSTTPTFAREVPGSDTIEFKPLNSKGLLPSLTHGPTVWLSATATPSLMESMGIPINFSYEAASPFPRENRRVFLMQGAPKVKFNMSPGELDKWIKLLRAIVVSRGNLRGVIHTGSFARAAQLYNLIPELHGKALVHTQASGRQPILDFAAGRGQWLLSPSATEGLDLKGDLCRTVIFPKIPFPDTSEPYAKAQHALDPDAGLRATAISIVQGAGRGCRSADDWCDTFMVDGNLHWAFKRDKLGRFFPSYFTEAMFSVNGTTIPKPSH